MSKDFKDRVLDLLGGEGTLELFMNARKFGNLEKSNVYTIIGVPSAESFGFWFTDGSGGKRYISFLNWGWIVNNCTGAATPTISVSVFRQNFFTGTSLVDSQTVSEESLKETVEKLSGRALLW